MTERRARDVAAGLATDLGVGRDVRGVLHYLSTRDTHTIAGREVDYVLANYVGREVLVVLAASEWAPTQICASCRTLYVGPGCMDCADEGW